MTLELSSRMVCQEDFAGKPVSRSMTGMQGDTQGLGFASVYDICDI